MVDILGICMTIILIFAEKRLEFYLSLLTASSEQNSKYIRNPISITVFVVKFPNEADRRDRYA